MAAASPRNARLRVDGDDGRRLLRLPLPGRALVAVGMVMMLDMILGSQSMLRAGRRWPRILLPAVPNSRPKRARLAAAHRIWWRHRTKQRYSSGPVGSG